MTVRGSVNIRRRLIDDRLPRNLTGRFSVLIGLAALVPYLLTLAPTISWRNGGIDSGELVTAMYVLGVAHPTGFPLYILLGHAFMILPIGEIAYRANLLSAVCAGGTVGFVAATSILITSRRPTVEWLIVLSAAAAGSFAFAFSPLFWARATIAKEYTLNTLFLAAGLWLLLTWRKHRQPAQLIAFAAVVGLGLADHLTSLSVLPGALGFILLVDSRSAFRWPIILRSIAVLLVCVSLYAYIPLRAIAVPYLDWGDPRTLSSFFDHVSGATYKDVLTHSSMKLADIAQRLLFGVRGIPDQIGWPALVGLLVGVSIAARSDRPGLILVGGPAVISLAFATLYSVRDSESYLLPLYLSGAILASVGFCEAGHAVFGKAGQYWRITRWHVAAILVVLTSILAGSSIWRSFEKVDVSHDTSARDYGEAVLAAAVPNAIVVTNHDETTFSLWYVQQVLGDRPDTVIIDERLIGWPWYRLSLARYFPDLGLSGPSPQSEQKLMRGDVPGRPVYLTTTPDFRTGKVVAAYLTPKAP